jgi:hypothetical protein
MLWLRLCEDCKFIPWFIIDAVRLCACSQGFESKPCREICEAYGLCHVSNYLGRIPKSRCCTNYKVVVYRIGQTSPVLPVSHFLHPPLAPPSLHSPVPRPPIPRSLVPPFLVSPFPVPPFPVPGFKDSRFQSISRFSTEKTIFLPVFNLQTLKTSLLLVFYSYVLVFYSYVTRMYSCVTRMYSYVTRMYSYVTRMYSCVTRMYSYVLVCYSYVTRMYSCGVLVTIQVWYHIS